MQAQRHMPDSGEFADPHPLIANALFGNDKRQQRQALKQIRANSGHSPRTWKELDKAFWRGFYDPTAVSANARTLDYEEWEDRDDMVVPETQEVLTAVDDLVNAGFTRDTSLARLVSVYQKSNDFDDIAERSMDGRARSVEDSTVKEIAGVPLPISHVDYEISAREQQNSQNFGEDLETEDAEKAGRELREDLEDLIFNGWGTSVTTERGTFSIGGYTTDSSRITGSATGDWGTPSNVLDTLDAMLADMEQQGPNNNEGYMPEQEGAWVYVPTAQWGQVTRQADPRGDGNMNIRTRIQQDYPYVDIRHAGSLSGGNIVMVAQNRNVVDLADAQAPTNMSWDVEGGMATRFKALACRVPRIKSTKAGRSGIVHYTGA